MNIEDLLKQGWEKKFTAYGNRLEESIQLFKDLGYEIYLESPEIPGDLPDKSCTNCFLTQLGKTIFVRKSDCKNHDSDNLFD